MDRTDMEINTICIRGRRAVSPDFDGINPDESIFIIALGVNDALYIGLGLETIDEFKASYADIINRATSNKVICLLPPMTSSDRTQPYMPAVWDAIREVCPNAIHSAESDAKDGIHYLDEANELNAQIAYDAIN
jgi:hypothetical protein